MAASPFAAVLTLTRIMQGFTLEGGVRAAAEQAVPKAAEQAAAPQLPQLPQPPQPPHSPRPVSAPAAMAADPLLFRPPKIRRIHGGPGNVAAALAAIDGAPAAVPPLRVPVAAHCAHGMKDGRALRGAQPLPPAGPAPPIRRPALRPRMLLPGRAGHVPPPAFGGCRLPVPEVM